MPNGFLDPNKFTLDPASMSSFQDRIAELRKGLPPTVQAMQPPIPGQPTGQPPVPPALQSAMPSPQPIPSQQPASPQMQQPRQQRMGLDEAAAPGGPANPSPSIGQPGDPTLQQLKESIAKLPPKILAELQRQATNIEPPKLIGADVFGRGGIMGTGVEPIDVLAFALGIGATWNLPQAQAQANTFEIASWPSKFKDNQRKAGGEFLQNAIGGMNAMSGASNAIASQAKQVQIEQQYQENLRLADAYDKLGRHADATALRAGAVSEHVALTGKKMEADKLPPNLMSELGGIISRVTPLDQIPPQVLARMGNPTDIMVARQKAWDWAKQNLLMTAPIPTPTGGAVVRGPGGAYELGGPQPSIESMMGPRPGGPSAVVPGAVAPIAPTGGPQHIPSLAATPQAPQQGAGSLIQQAQNSPSQYDKWVGRAAANDYLSPAIVDKANRLFQRPMDAGDRQKLIAQLAAYEYGKDLELAYNNMIKSYGGDDKYSLSRQLRQYGLTLGARITDPNILSTMFVDFMRKAAQSGKINELTDEAVEFAGAYAQSQAFAKGALNDTGNLANREREMFNNMIGQPMDRPDVFRTTLRRFYRQVATHYNSLLESNKLRAREGFEPLPVPPLPGQKSSGSRVITDPKELNKWLDLGPNGPATKPGELY